MKNLFKSKIKDRNYFNMWEYNIWGNRISWYDFKDRKIEGHIQCSMKAGDEVRCKMKSGQIVRFVVLDIEFNVDPSDQFFAEVKEIGYLKDISKKDEKNIKKLNENLKDDGLRLLI